MSCESRRDLLVEADRYDRIARNYERDAAVSQSAWDRDGLRHQAALWSQAAAEARAEADR